MSSKISIGPIRFDAVLDSEDPKIIAAVRRLFEAEAELFEAALTDCISRELARVLPGISVRCSGIKDDYPDDPCDSDDGTA